MLNILDLDTSENHIFTDKELEGSSVIKLSDKLIVVEQKENDLWLNFLFLEWYSDTLYTRNGEVMYSEWQALAVVSGTGDSLRECRHMHFFNNGYIFYLDKDNFLLMIDFLSKHFDLDQ